MAEPKNMDFYDTIANAMDQNHLKTRIERLWLGGSAGENGGVGQRPGGFIGQLNQTIVSYDTTEAETYLGSGSLLDNLNHIRFDVATLSGLLNSGIYDPTVRDADLSEIITDTSIITFSGFIVTNPSPNEAMIEIPSGYLNDRYINSSGDIIFGDLEVNNYLTGIILHSPDDTRWRVTVDNSGNLITTSL